MSLDADPRLQPRSMSEQLRPHAEQEYAHELAVLQHVDDQPRPPHWRLSPWAVVRYLMGGPLPDGTMIRPKCGLAPADRSGGGHPGHRSGAAASRRSRYGEVLGVRASGCGHLGRLHAVGTGNGGHCGRSHPVRMELRPLAR